MAVGGQSLWKVKPWATFFLPTFTVRRSVAQLFMLLAVAQLYRKYMDFWKLVNQIAHSVNTALGLIFHIFLKHLWDSLLGKEQKTNKMVLCGLFHFNNVR